MRTPILSRKEQDARARATTADLVAALYKYGRHGEKCASLVDPDHFKCDCGFAAALDASLTPTEG